MRGKGENGEAEADEEKEKNYGGAKGEWTRDGG
jgi:hypothetical protein